MFQRSFLFITVCILSFALVSSANFECLYQQEDLQVTMISLEEAVTLKDVVDITLYLDILRVVASNYNKVCENFSFDFGASNLSESAETCQSVFKVVEFAIDEYFANGELEKSSQKLIDLTSRFQNSCSNTVLGMSDE